MNNDCGNRARLAAAATAVEGEDLIGTVTVYQSMIFTCNNLSKCLVIVVLVAKSLCIAGSAASKRPRTDSASSLDPDTIPEDEAIGTDAAADSSDTESVMKSSASSDALEMALKVVKVEIPISDRDSPLPAPLASRLSAVTRPAATEAVFVPVKPVVCALGCGKVRNSTFQAGDAAASVPALRFVLRSSVRSKIVKL